ncbi:unnamed protein product [Lymnaea stagnalis]|uniref:Uncharacterized protein n=1 Tax=Lymnaea stagnalis TaxID=6523 RepID=A0AAV2I5C6_LYMST
MALAFENYDAWVLSPYCFCPNKNWLSVEGLSYIDGPVITQLEGDGMAALPGLSRHETALLAALLMALAVFLFLLYLLVCCLCPFGLCCGKNGWCCSKTGHSKNAKVSSGKGSSAVNLTAVDMKIPRPWMDGYSGYSDSELEKTKRSTDLTRWDDDENLWGRGSTRGFSNSAFQGDNLKNGGWFSTSDLDSVYGVGRDRSVRSKQAWMGTRSGDKGRQFISMGGYYLSSANKKDYGNVNSSVRRRRSFSDFIDQVMSPYSTDDTRNARDNHSGNYGDSVHRHAEIYSVVGPGGLQKEDRGQVIETSTYNKREAVRSLAQPVSIAGNDQNSTPMNAITEISLGNTTRDSDPAGTLVVYNGDSGKPDGYAHSYKTTSMTSVDNGSDGSMERNFHRDSAYPQHNLITEITSSYKKRVIEETETVTI